MQNHFIDLFQYNAWANSRTIDSILKTDNLDEKAYKLFSHIIAAQTIWLSRIKGEGSYPVQPWHVYDPGSFREIAEEINNKWIEFISITPDEKYAEAFTYKTGAGEFTNKIGDAAAHVINHSTYHRGQIAAIVRACGKEPAITDYVFYKRG